MQQTHQSMPPFNSQQQFDNSNKSMPLIGMNIREILQDNLANSLCNVPEWLVKEGGELRLSETPNGSSIIRYWPRYMNDTGHQTLFQSLRKTVKWHQRRYLIGSPSDNNWVSLPKLLSWIGPCNYEKDGMILPANTQWPPEVVDLLHRLIHFSNSQFNSCLMSLYNTGYSNQPWHSEVHEAMPKNPTTACISLGKFMNYLKVIMIYIYFFFFFFFFFFFYRCHHSRAEPFSRRGHTNMEK
ncbi:Alpha-ketoglutarate-dependent dioxygenase alkB-like protein 3, partial [Armadillidium vulgare]